MERLRRDRLLILGVLAAADSHTLQGATPCFPLPNGKGQASRGTRPVPSRAAGLAALGPKAVDVAFAECSPWVVGVRTVHEEGSSPPVSLTHRPWWGTRILWSAGFRQILFWCIISRRTFVA